jgi:hypothetical protein
MKCVFCEHELTLEMLREQGCGACLGGCRKIHCPYCGQENPVVPEILDKLFGRGTAVPEKGNEP